MDRSAVVGRKGSAMVQVEAPRRERGTAIVAGVASCVIDNYDLAVYGYLAIVMGQLFFPDGDPAVRLLSSLAVFGLSFLIRPVGAYALAPLADRIGRTPMMIVFIVAFAIATALIGVLPTYQTAGAAATASLIVLRLVQGVATGGESATAVSFIAEFARPGKRGFATSWYVWASVLGFLAGAIVVAIFNAALGDAAMLAFGWRIVFLIAAPLGLIGIIVRLRVHESPDFTVLRDEGGVDRVPWKRVWGQWRSLLLCGGIAVLHSVGFYTVFSYAPSFVQTTSKIAPTTAFVSTIVAGAIALVVLPFSGLASDRFGRRPVLLVGAIWTGVVAYPAFLLMSSGAVAGAFVGQALIAIGVGIFDSTSTGTMAELFPTNLRSSGWGVGYNIPAALFGGSAPFVLALLVASTGNSSVPAVYLLLAVVIALVTLGFVSRKRLHAELDEVELQVAVAEAATDRRGSRVA